MTQTILCDRGDELQVIEEEKIMWIHDVLLAIGVDQEILESDDKMNFIQYCDSHFIYVDHNITDGSVSIFRQDKLIGEWKMPSLVLKKEAKNKYYYEIKLNEWALPFQMKERK